MVVRMQDKNAHVSMQGLHGKAYARDTRPTYQVWMRAVLARRRSRSPFRTTDVTDGKAVLFYDSKRSVVQFRPWIRSSSSRSSLETASTCFCSWETFTVERILISFWE